MLKYACRVLYYFESLGSDVKQTKSFCYYIDHCLEECINLMNSDYKEPLNIGSDEMVTIDEMADMIIDISGKQITKIYDSLKPQGVRGRNSDNNLIEKVLGWIPSISLKEGLKKTYPWIKEQIEEK